MFAVLTFYCFFQLAKLLKLFRFGRYENQGNKVGRVRSRKVY